MSADVADLLASIDDVLENVSAPVPVPAPAAPVDPVVTAGPVEAPAAPEPGGRGDWWNALYETPQAGADTAEAVAPTAVGGARVSAAPRLPYWWQKPQQEEAGPTRVDAADTADTAGADRPRQPEQACGHEGRVLLLRQEPGGEVLGRLCLDCDQGLPASDPEPEAECAHEERLEARSESGKLVGYVCAAPACRVRLTKEEVHGRLGKWLHPATSYYPKIRNPLSPAAKGADGEPPKQALSAGTRRLLANAGAAGAGYVLGLTPMFGTWIEECGRTTSIGGALFLGGSMCLAIGHFWDRRTRHWYPGLAWAARIPLASAITALALYAPASQI